MKNILGSCISTYKGSEVGKCLMPFSEELKEGRAAKKLWTCLRWGWKSRQGLTVYRSLWKVLSRKGTGLDHFALGGARTELETSWEATRVVLVTKASSCGDGEKGMSWRHNLAVVLIGLGDWDVGRDWKGGGKADSYFWHEQLCRCKCMQKLPFKRFCVPKIPHTRSLFSPLDAITLPPSQYNHLDHCSFSLVSLLLVCVYFKSPHAALSSYYSSGHIISLSNTSDGFLSPT